MKYKVQRGCPHPLGARVCENGVNFSVFSQSATSVCLYLFNEHDDPEPFQIIELDPKKNRTFYFWHVFVEGLKEGMHYGYSVDGPRDTGLGHRFDHEKLLLDPYGFGSTDNLWVRGNACVKGSNLTTAMRNVIIDIENYDWEGDRPLNRPMNETIIYEMHVKGFTAGKGAKVRNPGTYKGIIEKIPYLKKLGITAVELLPVMQFDDKAVIGHSPDGEPLTNYWGYSTISFFSPHPGYCVSPEEGEHIKEFRDMVKALHKEGIEVIMDVVFNHTDEGNHKGPMINFKGFDNSVYYHLVESEKQFYMDYTGCGNTFKCNHPIPEKLIRECLEFWVEEMHVDGFRFDEGSILSRDENGKPLKFPPILWQIELSEALADTKLIAEAWDAAGLYQIGSFPGIRWAEWNGKYRDAVRRFVKGDAGGIGELANRMSGSSDLYSPSGRMPVNSVNFITCHDGFTLYDLTAYDSKHNHANGEDNRDGIDENLSWNCGAEGETDDEAVNSLRKRQIKNFLTILLISKGVPMITAGDEICRTQQGNNNAYCQDNEISWTDWTFAEKNADILEYVQKLIKMRKRFHALRSAEFFSDGKDKNGMPEVTWHGTELNRPNWDDEGSRVLAFTLSAMDGKTYLHVMMNMYWEPLRFGVPAIKGIKWGLLADTAQNSPDDFSDFKSMPSVEADSVTVQGRSIVILLSN
ncbi:glycogen debranching protein GlgX [Seleniivibrio woodruffii]|uniref:glycogen debranching protein GlgX n=1 Tax=Seleniivibrio woodruffii TaxID=1078050 RepID=UPI0039E3F188